MTSSGVTRTTHYQTMRTITVVSCIALAGVALLFALRDSKPAPPVPMPRLVGFIDDTNDVEPGELLAYGGTPIAEVMSARRVGTRTRVEFRLTRPEAPLRKSDSLRRVVSPLGWSSRLAVAIGDSSAPLLAPGDSLPAARTLDWADTLGHATRALPGLVRDVRQGVDEIKKRPQLYKP